MQPRKILVVDDSKLIHKMFEVLLRQFSLVHAHDGLEALQCLGTHSEIDLILLDINMPKMSGLEFLAQIKGDTVFKQIPVVIISTEGKEEDTIRGLEAGAGGPLPGGKGLRGPRRAGSPPGGLQVSTKMRLQKSFTMA